MGVIVPIELRRQIESETETACLLKSENMTRRPGNSQAKMNMEAHYLNTDLEIESKDDLSRIVEEFGDAVLLLHHGEIRGYQHASFEIAGNCDGADEVINHFCSLVENLPKEVRELWDRCCSRVLDIGYESGTTTSGYRSEIRDTTIQRVAGIGASVVITIYPLRK